MTLKPKPIEAQEKTGKLRELRLADETARKAAGTWGDLTVGEVTHEASGSTYVQIWKGSRRPDLAVAPSATAAHVPVEDWPAVLAWLKATRATGFGHNVIGWTLSKAEAQRIKASRIAERRGAGLTVINVAEDNVVKLPKRRKA